MSCLRQASATVSLLDVSDFTACPFLCCGATYFSSRFSRNPLSGMAVQPVLAISTDASFCCGFPQYLAVCS